MKILISRRAVLRNVATAGAGALFASIAAAQDKPIQIAGKSVEVTLTAVTPHAVRIAIQPLENGQPKPIPQDGALERGKVVEHWDVLQVLCLITQRTTTRCFKRMAVGRATHHMQRGVSLCRHTDLRRF